MLVGSSSKGRKGSSWDHVERLMRGVDRHFIDHCVSSGMSSGEGLIAEVADDEERQPRQRRLVVESEFAQVMKVLSREGRRSCCATSPGTELADGFFNRVMLVAVRRSKKLPFGGALGDEDLNDVRAQVSAALLFAAQRPEPLAFDAEAREQWIAVYDELSDGHPGLWGAATARAEAHTVRLALLYAQLDRTPAIRVEHLDAALAFWYASESAHWVFGDSLGDPTADEIWEMTRTNPDAVARTQVSDLFSRNNRAREIDRALTALIEAGRLERGEHRTGNAGRPAVVWRPVAPGPLDHARATRRNRPSAAAAHGTP